MAIIPCIVQLVFATSDTKPVDTHQLPIAFLRAKLKITVEKSGHIMLIDFKTLFLPLQPRNREMKEQRNREMKESPTGFKSEQIGTLFLDFFLDSTRFWAGGSKAGLIHDTISNLWSDLRIDA